jgi:NAD(P)-dependent dehydrogenase (short-subunit alcohol dehydrogenase family)
MTPPPATWMAGYRPAGKLAGKAAIATGGDSGTGQAVAHAFTGILGHGALVDYAAPKGAVRLFTESLPLGLARRGIRVNAVAPGPVCTPIVTTLRTGGALKEFGAGSALGRAAQPEELAPVHVHLGSSDASFATGTVFEVSGGLPGAV